LRRNSASEAANPLKTGSLRPPRFFRPHPIRNNAHARPAARQWWFRSSLHRPAGSSSERLNPKSHQNHKIASVPGISKFASKAAARTCQLRSRDTSGRGLREGYPKVNARLGVEAVAARATYNAHAMLTARVVGNDGSE
jgi:hypothetical protein